MNDEPPSTPAWPSGAQQGDIAWVSVQDQYHVPSQGWVSEDGGKTWQRTGWSINWRFRWLARLVKRILDAADPS